MELVGTWRSDPSDVAGLRKYGDITLQFLSDGTLLYTVRESESGKASMACLTYRTEPGFLITDQPSQPRLERTKYHIGEDGVLVLESGDQKTRYVKVSEGGEIEIN
jgi:hypothetical protein